MLVTSLSGFLWSKLLIVLLLLSGLYYSLKTGLVQIKYFPDMLHLISGKLSALGEGEKKGKEVSAFQAFCISVSSHVGTGNLAGVAIALVLGGPGALFWMWMTAILGAATSFVENCLAQLYKERDGEGGFRGGPAYYMEKALGWKRGGKIFSLIVIFTFAFAFNTVQSNTIAQALQGSFGLSLSKAGLCLLLLSAAVIFGGIKRIAKFSAFVVPIMAMAYVLVALVVLCMNAREIPALFSLILRSAFGLDAMAGGAMGVAVLQGVKRGLYSNEAGMGSAPNAAATAAVSHPVKQALLQSFGVFVDTILICSATGFIVLMLPNYGEQGLQGIQLTQLALSNEIGIWGSPFISLCIFMFAFSSLIGNYYYGETNLEFLFGDSKYLLRGFRLLSLAVIYLGAVANLEDVWNVADLCMGIMALMNILAIALLSPKAFLALGDYRLQRNLGKNPVYRAKRTPEIKKTEVWD